MNRSIKAGLAAAAGLALSLGGTSTAAATEPEPGPGKTVTTKVDTTFVLPKNAACNVAVEVHNKATTSISITSDGRYVTTLAPDGRTRIKNLKTGKTYSFKNDGSFVDQVRKNGNFKSWGFGRNTYFGKGIKGILYTNGVQRFDVRKPFTEDQVIKMRRIDGKSVQLCYKIGAKPVKGKNASAE
jgi:hypothetical protein